MTTIQLAIPHYKLFILCIIQEIRFPTNRVFAISYFNVNIPQIHFQISLYRRQYWPPTYHGVKKEVVL